MQLTREQFDQIAPLLPRQRGNVRLDNFEVVNAILYVAANGCKWRALPSHYGPWHSVYTRMNRWAKAGVLDTVFTHLQKQRLMQVRIEAVSLDSTIMKVHPDGTGAPKKAGPQSIGKSRGGWTTKLHLVAASACDVVTWSLTPGQAADGPEGRRLIEAMGGPQEAGEVLLLMDSAYEGDATRELAEQLGFVAVVPPNPQRKQPWTLDKQSYRRRNEVERLFRRLKAWRRVFTRYDKLDVMFAAFITVALVAEALRLR
ncbi:MAG: IS5 family transposase [Sphaerotilus sulfidivorans]|uniref:IS5 family transposase n=1 Tax=Sphaerotilus sulfidivorans TaxID=639200 RepID=UPI003F35B8F1